MPHTGLFQYLKFGEGAASTGAGIVDGGDLQLDPQVRVRLGIGGTESRRGGVVVPSGSASMYITATNQELFAAALRDSYPRGDLTALEIEGGTDAWALQYHACWITDAQIDYARGDGLKGTVNWSGMTVGYNGEGSSQPEEANATIEDYEFVVQFEEEEFNVNEVGISIANNCIFETSGNTPTEGFERLPRLRNVGAEDLTVSFSTDDPLPLGALDMYGQCMPTDLEITLVGTGCNDQVTMELTDLMPSDAVTMAFVDASTLGGFAYGFQGSAWNGSLGWAWA
jgi:hypothetical protein